MSWSYILALIFLQTQWVLLFCRLKFFGNFSWLIFLSISSFVLFLFHVIWSFFLACLPFLLLSLWSFFTFLYIPFYSLHFLDTLYRIFKFILPWVFYSLLCIIHAWDDFFSFISFLILVSFLLIPFFICPWLFLVFGFLTQNGFTYPQILIWVY